MIEKYVMPAEAGIHVRHLCHRLNGLRLRRNDDGFKNTKVAKRWGVAK